MHRPLLENPTRLICTLGPASRDPATLDRLLEAGLDVARINFSHATPETITPTVRTLRELAAARGRPVAILGDLQGPKIRTGSLVGGGPVALWPGATLVITTEPVTGTAERVSTTYQALAQDVHPGDPILLDDGAISLRVVAVEGSEVQTQVVDGGDLGEHKGINLPGVAISSPSVTDKDREDLRYLVEQQFDFVAQSFVRSVEDVRLLKRLLAQLGADTPVIAKIEKPEAIGDLEAIVAEADALMVARGDLGVEMPPEEVPILQRRIMSLCAQQRKPVIIATQMLESMREQPRPTRAEASDVANAVFHGADAVMLSGETAAGKYPVESAQMMQRICAAAEREYMAGKHLRTDYSESGFASDSDALARASAELAEAVGAAAIVAFTQSGSTARLISMCRTRVPVLALTPLAATARRCCLYWGVVPVLIPAPASSEEMRSEVTRVLKERGWVQPGDVIVITSGTVGHTGTTDTIRLQTVT